jgi:hypothetical protein
MESDQEEIMHSLCKELRDFMEGIKHPEAYKTQALLAAALSRIALNHGVSLEDFRSDFVPDMLQQYELAAKKVEELKGVLDDFAKGLKS